ncbi:hypothetical protein PILCRDRAFT_8663 [Piloderma croceum F 1598]|uniref:Uncharacterized protein n=1 Tax=Piloderma croceum (strain F 1598) TaxID=765440 RepID=A0A0C3FAJ9_PILCF|nr:hypothetical protein PILCRDRAFT_8663 [Piloderma croceum F 1598]
MTLRKDLTSPLTNLGSASSSVLKAYLACFVKYPGIEKDGGLQLVAQRVEVLIALIEAVKSKDPPKMGTRPPKKTNTGKRSRAESDSGKEANDKTYKLKTIPSASESSSSNSAEDITEVNSAASKSKKPKKKKAKTVTAVASDNDSDIIIEEIDGPKAGRNPMKAKWAFTLWQPRAATVKQRPVWRWGCRHCS